MLRKERKWKRDGNTVINMPHCHRDFYRGNRKEKMGREGRISFTSRLQIISLKEERSRMGREKEREKKLKEKRERERADFQFHLLTFLHHKGTRIMIVCVIFFRSRIDFH